MERKKHLCYIFLAVAVLTLMVSFYLFDRLLLALAALLPLGSMLFARRSTLSWSAHLSLAGFAGLSAIGVLYEIPLMPLVLASTAALASWDMMLEMHVESPTTQLYDRFHLIYLGTALGLGLLGIGVFQWLHWRLSFIGILALGIGMLVCLNQVMNYIQKNMDSHH